MKNNKYTLLGILAVLMIVLNGCFEPISSATSVAELTEEKTEEKLATTSTGVTPTEETAPTATAEEISTNAPTEVISLTATAVTTPLDSPTTSPTIMSPALTPAPTSTPPPTLSATLPLSETPAPGNLYKFTTGDSLSFVAWQTFDGRYGVWEAIRHWHDLRAKELDLSPIENPDIIEVGKVIYVPTDLEVDQYFTPKISVTVDITISNNIGIAGSSTVHPLTERIIELFKAQAGSFSGTINNLETGSKGGFEMFCQTDLKTIQIVNASDSIDEQIYEEILASCANTTPEPREPIAFEIGRDAIVVVVNKRNPLLQNEAFQNTKFNVTIDELQRILGRVSGTPTAVNWSDVRAEWPDQPINRRYPGLSSGTFYVTARKLFNRDYSDLI